MINLEGLIEFLEEYSLLISLSCFSILLFAIILGFTFLRETVSEREEEMGELKSLVRGLQELVDELAKKSSVDMATTQEKISSSHKTIREVETIIRGVSVNSSGLWGEIQLRNILEAYGLKENKDFFYNKSFEEGIRPDFCIKVDSYWLIIDVKTPIKNYATYVTSQNPKYLKEHASSVKRHLKSLSEKKYNRYFKKSMVCMFLPFEALWDQACKEDLSILGTSFEEGIFACTPTSLGFFISSLKRFVGILDFTENEEQNFKQVVIANSELNVAMKESDEAFKTLVVRLAKLEKGVSQRTKAAILRLSKVVGHGGKN